MLNHNPAGNRRATVAIWLRAGDKQALVTLGIILSSEVVETGKYRINY